MRWIAILWLFHAIAGHANLFDYARYGLDNLIHVARNPSVA